MADIELVIKMPEDRYKYIQSYDWKNAERLFSEEWKAIHNGRLLPKGHGRLIDADAYKEEMLNSREFDFFKRLDMQPTIIEADNVESEDKE